MSDSTKLPKIDWTREDTAEAMNMFKQHCDLYFGMNDIKKDRQVQHILFWSGEEGLKKFNSCGMSDDDAKDPVKVWKKF